MKGSMHAVARLVLWGVVATATLEVVVGALAYRDRLGPSDWDSLRTALETLPPAMPVVLADEWLGPRARMEVPRLARPSAVAPPDRLGLPQIAVVSLDADPSAFVDPLGGAFEVDERIEAGAFTVTSLVATHPLETISDWLDEDSAPALDVRVGGERCRASNGWRCKSGRVTARYAEVEYAPRRCLVVEAGENDDVVVRASDMPTGDLLRGHVGFTDFNGRLRSDAPVRVTLQVDDAVVGRFIATDAQGWRAFEVPVSPGRHDVEVHLALTVVGTYGSEGYETRPTRPLCFELRSLGVPQ